MSDHLSRGRDAERPRLPPEVPAQSAGPHVELNDEGVIVRAPPEALDRDGNHLTRLRSLHPELRSLVRELSTALGEGNRPYSVLGERAAAYAAQMDRNLGEIDFGRLYLAGVRLENASHETQRLIAGGELPHMDASLGEKLASVIALHGVFILGTAEGLSAKLAEERYQRRPDEERQYRSTAVALAKQLQSRPDLVERDVASEVIQSASEIGAGRIAERSTIAGHATLRNVVISLAAGAIGSAILSNPALLLAAGGGVAAWFGGLAVNESLKKSGFFRDLTDRGGSAIDVATRFAHERTAMAFKAGLDRHAAFIANHEQVLTRLSAWWADMKFLSGMLDWFRVHRSAQSARTAAASEGSDASRIFGSRMVIELSLGQLANHLRDAAEARREARLPLGVLDEQLQFPPGGTKALLALGVPFEGMSVEVVGGDTAAIRILDRG